MSPRPGPTTLRAVTFDCWGTLITDRDMAPATARRAEALCELAGGSLDHEEATGLLGEAWRAHLEAWHAGRDHGSPRMARFCVEALGIRPEDGALERLTRTFEEAATLAEVRPLDGAAETLRALRGAGIRTALVCDTGFTPGRVVRRLLAEAGVADELESFAFSNEVGVPKPHERMFRTALDAVGTEPADAVHVGDLRRTDVAGAKALGMGSVRIADVNDDPPAEGLPEANAVVASHTDLRGALRDLGVPLPL